MGISLNPILNSFQKTVKQYNISDDLIQAFLKSMKLDLVKSGYHTKEEYDEYIALWAKREFKPTEEVILVLRKTIGDTWTLTATGSAGVISTLRYNPSKDSFHSPGGDLNRLKDINTDENHILGAWTAKEWRFQENSLLGLTKLNFAVGKFNKGEFGIIIYHAQEISPKGSRVHDKSIVLRFPLGKATQVKPQTKPKKTK